MRRSLSIARMQLSEFKLIRLLFLLFLISQLTFLEVYPCTIFYSSQNGIILAGNNEDWKDPESYMWIYPASDSAFGWIKFGWSNGFPQGGMNDQGLFWDGTSNPYLDMPDAEVNKILIDGPIMQKVITESGNITDALEIFNQYYCEDQYRAQYLLGDSTGKSMVVEGDNVISGQSDFQVLTNFYQSHPDLGGYPCWRYETAVELLENCDSLTTWFAGTVLASTHQEGKYPTQYSNIYDLKNGIIYLFYNHNYEEFLVINLKEELEKGYNTYAIPKIFSKVNIKDPIISGTSATFKWKGLSDSEYDILISENPDFTETIISCSRSFDIKHNRSTMFVIIVSFVLVGSFFILLQNQKPRYFVPFIFGMSLLVNCAKDDTTPDTTDNTIEFSKVVDGLVPETTYYWKIRSSSGYTESFFTETATQSFKTLS